MNPWVATIITVALGVGLGLTGYQLVWPLFGAANQLLAALGLLAVCAWLGNAGRNNKMALHPPWRLAMVVTLTSLALTVWAKITVFWPPARWMPLPCCNWSSACCSWCSPSSWPQRAAEPSSAQETGRFRLRSCARVAFAPLGPIP
ncbi:MAG: carbon starvation CstA family protein [Adlercreutzia equolifaciens]